MTFPPDERTVGETNLQEIVEIPMYGKKHIVLDATVLTTLMNCPRLADFRFNHNFISIGGKSNSLECGSIVHTFLEFYYQSIIRGATRDKAEGFAFAAAEMYIQGCKYCTDFKPHDCKMCEGTGYFESESIGDNAIIDKRVCQEQGCVGGKITKPICGHQIDQFPGTPNTPRTPDKDNPREKYKIGWAWVLETCQQYLDHYRNDHWVPLETEIVKGQILYEDDEVRILWKAKLDIVMDNNQGVYPVDTKTMKQRRDTVSLNNQFIGQCLVMGTRNVFINKVGFQTTLKPEEKFERVPVSYSAPRLMEWQSEILPYYGKLLLMYAETGYWPPNFTNCESKFGKCSFFGICESQPDMREEELKLHFMIGKEWNPTNDTEED
jgi:hypothetical protein